MRAPSRTVALLTAAYFSLLAPPQAGGAEISGNGWQLRDLTDRRVVLLGGRSKPVTERLAYRLPKSAEQGSNHWYLMRLDFTIVFRKGTKAGRAYVSGLSNGWAGAQIEFWRNSRRPATIHWKSLDLIRGIRDGTTSKRSITLSYRNYLPYRAIVGGLNHQMFRLEEFGRLGVERVLVHETSGVVRSVRSPAQLQLSVEPQLISTSPGSVVNLTYRLDNIGDRPARDVRVVGMNPGSHPGVQIVEPDRVPSLRGNTRGKIPLHVKSAGLHRVSIAALGGIRPSHRTIIVAATYPSSETGPPAGFFAGLCAIALGIALMFSRTLRPFRS